MTIPLRGPTTAKPIRGRKLLLRALVVVHFSPILKIADQTGAGIADFQEEVRDRYPDAVLELEDLVQFEFRSDGLHPQHQRMPVWRLFDVDRQWRLSLTRQSLGFEVKGDAYTNWADFSDRVQAVVEAIASHFKPARVQRIGVRYVNGEAVNGKTDPREECTKELVSISGEQELIQSDLLWRFPVDEGLLILRSGMLAPGASYDPGVFEANEKQRMWYLDIDVIRELDSPFEGGEICQSILRQVKRAHEIYRWAMPGPAGGRKV